MRVLDVSAIPSDDQRTVMVVIRFQLSEGQWVLEERVWRRGPQLNTGTHALPRTSAPAFIDRMRLATAYELIPKICETHGLLETAVRQAIGDYFQFEAGAGRSGT